MTSPLRLSYPLCLCSPFITAMLWGAYFVLSLSASNFAFEYNLLSLWDELCFSRGTAEPRHLFLMRDHLRPRLELSEARLSVLTH